MSSYTGRVSLSPVANPKLTRSRGMEESEANNGDTSGGMAGICDDDVPVGGTIIGGAPVGLIIGGERGG